MKLLLVDDNETERAVLRDILRAQGDWTIVEAGDGQQAIELLREGLNPAVCLIDIRMPKIDGHQLLTLIRQEQALRHLKVIITSATRDRDVVVSIGKLGISGYLLKPYDAAKTGASLTQLLGAAHVSIPALMSRNLLQKTALVVDDDRLTRDLLRDILARQQGWEIVEAEDGLAAHEQLRGGLRPDLGIFDLRMPRLDGLSLLSRIREDAGLRRLPVVVISGEQDREKVRALAQLGISGYVLKPIEIPKANAVIMQAVGAINATTAA